VKKSLNQKNAQIKTWATGRLAFAALVLTGLFLFSAFDARAQRGYRVTKRITFKSGEVSTTIRGTIPNTLEGHEYIFRARQGQTLLVKLKSAKSDIGFFIETPDGETLDGETGLKNWSGELDETGDYHLFINTGSKGAARYTLEIQIATDI
jgi:hypothetical protein